MGTLADDAALQRTSPGMTPRTRAMIALGGAVALNGLILGALGLGRGPGRQGLGEPEAQSSTIWLSLEPSAPFPITQRGADSNDGEPMPPGEPSAPDSPSAELWAVAGSSAALAPTPPDISDSATAAVGVDMRDRIARSLRTRLACSQDRDRLSAAERVDCDARVVRDATPITGSGNPRLDRRFERQGARQLAGYEARRQRLAGAVRPRCEDAGPVSDCGVDVSIEIFSSVDGFFPGLRPDDDE